MTVETAKYETVGEVISGFMGYLGENGRSANTLAAYRSEISLLLALNAIDMSAPADSLRRIDQQLVEGYMTFMFRSPKTRSRRLASSRTFLKYCAQEGVVDYNPATGIRYPETGETAPAFITREDFEKMMVHIPRKRFKDIRDGCIISMGYREGLRPGEIIKLKCGSIENADRKGVLRLGRTRGDVEIGISEGTLAEMDAYEGAYREKFHAHVCESPDSVYYVSSLGRPLGRRNILRYISQLGEDALGRDDINPRTIHNGHIVGLIEKGLPVHDIVRLAGTTYDTVDMLKRAANLG
jgi:site-specific recombinase XerD